MPPRNNKRATSSAGRTPAPDKSAKARREEEGVRTKKFTPQRKLNFADFDQASVKKLAPQFSAGKAKKLDVRCIIVAQHMAIVIPAWAMDGWVANLADGIALAKSINMNGFKLAPGIATGDGSTRFGYYGFFADAETELKKLFSAENDDKFGDIKIGKKDPNSDPPKVPTDYTGMRMGDVASKCNFEIVKLTEQGTNLIDYLNDKQGLRLLGAFQVFATAIGAVSKDMDFTFLQELQDEYGDLIPDHKDDGQDVLKFFQRVSPVMNVNR